MRRSIPTIPSTLEHTRARPRKIRGLALWVAVSAVLHAGLLVALPGMDLRDAGRVEILSVTLAKQEAPRVLEAPAARSRERPEAGRIKRAPTDKPPRAPGPPERATAPAQEPAPRPVLTLPRPAGETQSAFTIPVSPLPAPSAVSPPGPEAAPAATRAEAARSAPSAASVPAEALVTPPSFNAGYLRNPPPRYPLLARRNGEQGTVTLKVLVTRDGLPATVSVHATSGSENLDRAAVEAVKGWRFAPARQGAQAVEAWVLVPIVFKLEGVS